MRKGYSDSTFGQIHWRCLDADGAQTEPDLYCLHPAPFSGLAFTRLMPHLNRGRRIIAPDYPGYGGSDPHTLTPSIEDYADAMLAVIAEMSGDTAVDLVGFHTGCLVAAEIARRHPSRVRRACLIDVPAFPADQSAGLASKVGAPLALTGDLACLEKPWASHEKRLASQPMDEAFEMFVEQIRPGRAMNAAFHAAFSYPWQDRFPALKSEIAVIASQSGLLEGSRLAAKTIPDARLIERLDITRSVLDEAASVTGPVIETILRAAR